MRHGFTVIPIHFPHSTTWKRIRMRRSTLFFSLTVLVGAPHAPALAQQAGELKSVPLRFPTDDPVIKRIWSIGMDSSHGARLPSSRSVRPVVRPANPIFPATGRQSSS